MDGDLIKGTNGDDLLEAGPGDDLLVAGQGDDTLVASAGDDTLIGNHGDDLYVIRPGTGSTTILGFTAGEGTPDRIELVDSGLDSFEAVMAHASLVEGGTLFALADGTTILVNGRKPSDFHPDDFLLTTTIQPLFSEAGETVDFNDVAAGSYVDGTQYAALDGDDRVVLAATASAAALAGYTVGTAFDAGGGADTVIGGALAETVDGGDGDDLLVAGGGADSLTGGAGDDTVEVGDGAENAAFDGGEGEDTFVYATDGLLRLGSGNEVFQGFGYLGTASADAFSLIRFETFDITAGDGADQINLAILAGDDTIDAGEGQNRVFLGAGVDTYTGGADGDLVNLRTLDGDQLDFDGSGGGERPRAQSDRLQLNDATGTVIDLRDGVATRDGVTSSVIGVDWLEISRGTDFVIRPNLDGTRVHLGIGASSSGVGIADGIVDMRGIDRGEIVTSSLDGIDFLSDLIPGQSYFSGSDTMTLRKTLGDVEIDLGAGTYTYEGATGRMENFISLRALGTANQTVTGSDRGESIDTQFGADTLSMGGGDDAVRLYDLGGDVLDGGDGRDVLIVGGFGADLPPAFTINLATGEVGDSIATNFEDYQGSAADEIIIGTEAANDLNGQSGDDTIHSVGGGDIAAREFNYLRGFDGQDTYYVAGMNDLVQDSFNPDGFVDTIVLLDTAVSGPREIGITGYGHEDGDVIDFTDLGVTEAEARAGFREDVARAIDFIEIGDLTVEIYASDDRGFDDYHFIFA